MTFTRLWTLSVTCTAGIAEAVAECLEDEAVSVTTLAPPRIETAKVEANFDFEPSKPEMTARLALCASLAGGDILSLDINEIENLDWLKKVATDFPPLPIARWTVYGAAHRQAVQGNRLALQIDATSAFGTGEHPTTRGCLILLDELLNRKTPRTMLDVGCGSGILAMAFAKSTQGRAVAVDLDPESVRIAKANVTANGLSGQILTERSRGYAAPIVAAHAPYDLIMANIFARPLAQIAKDLKRHLSKDGDVILSGILNHQANMVIAAHRQQNLALTKRLSLGEWTVLAFSAHPSAS